MDEKKIEKWVQQLTPLDHLLSHAQGGRNLQSIRSYYVLNNLIYRKFHSEEGAMHLPVKFNEAQRHVEKLRFQSQQIQSLIDAHSYTKILELGCGMGYNINRLASLNPHVDFTGIDLTAKNIRIARKNAKGLANIIYNQQDFNDLTLDTSYDVVFAVETLCYGIDLQSILQKVLHHIKPGGKLVIFDLYEHEKTSTIPDLIQKAYQWHTWGFSLSRYHPLSLINEGFPNAQILDYSTNILSNVAAFEKGSLNGLAALPLLKVLIRCGIFPIPIFKHLVAGLFMHHLIARGFLGYHQIIIGKDV